MHSAWLRAVVAMSLFHDGRSAQPAGEEHHRKGFPAAMLLYRSLCCFCSALAASIGVVRVEATNCINTSTQQPASASCIVLVIRSTRSSRQQRLYVLPEWPRKLAALVLGLPPCTVHPYPHATLPCANATHERYVSEWNPISMQSVSSRIAAVMSVPCRPCVHIAREQCSMRVH